MRLDLDFISLPTDATNVRAPTTGTCTISDASKGIVYAKTNVEMKIQGHSSARDKKKGYTIDFYNIDGDDLDLKFGDTIASSSYHLKGFYRDPSHMRDQGGYRCWKELVQKLDYPYSKINNIVYSASPSRPTDADFTADAKYYPHGFPVEVHLNGDFYGLYTLRLKKTRTNYALNNANTDHIFLDSGTNSAYLKEPFDATDWEIKSPKMSGYDDLGPIPPAFTGTVGASCTRLFEFTSTLSTSYPNHADYIVLPHWILWYLTCELVGAWDQNGNNYNIITWNNQQWSIIPYDFDMTLNWSETESGSMRSNYVLSTDIWITFRTVFEPEIKALWTKYRKNGDISVEQVVKHYRNAVSHVPRKIYKADKDKWGIFPSFENENYPDLEQAYRWFEARIAFLDSRYLIV
ncbi:CotH kinase family protein [Acinetobacter sp. YH12103]|uniref:CotH kinase family protein n=1 Tax=Acinetobacter sp. YH12103 TaxID=2601092 RepID=UPI0015D3FFCA|nr:CotH kinase family protein [Acinetobacter sp. YH12103]